MAPLEIMNLLGFALWNTRLAPPSRAPNNTDEHLKLARHVIADIVLGNRTQLLALTEVRRLKVLSLLPDLLRPRWEAICDTSGEKHDFDIALLLDRTRFAIERKEWVRDFNGGSCVRCGLICLLRLCDSTPVIVAVAHWKSNVGIQSQAEACRNAAATALKKAIGRMLRDVGTPVHVLVLGDFNAEPYDNVFHALPTSRDRRAVLRHRPKTWEDLLLYNASWRWLGETEPWAGIKVWSVAGTYNNGSKNSHAWKTFDQLLVSSSLLATRGWLLREDLTGVHCPPSLIDESTGQLVKPIDHLPIIGKLDCRSEERTE